MCFRLEKRDFNTFYILEYVCVDIENNAETHSTDVELSGFPSFEYYEKASFWNRFKSFFFLSIAIISTFSFLSLLLFVFTSYSFNVLLHLSHLLILTYLAQGPEEFRVNKWITFSPWKMSIQLSILVAWHD